jgi:hypothetical protein
MFLKNSQRKRHPTPKRRQRLCQFNSLVKPHEQNPRSRKPKVLQRDKKLNLSAIKISAKQEIQTQRRSPLLRDTVLKVARTLSGIKSIPQYPDVHFHELCVKNHRP